jgi:hypothetical protein
MLAHPEIVAEIRKTIDDFPNYEVSNYGRFFNVRTGREMKLSPTMNGDLTVGLMKDGHQFRFSAKGIVARTFVEGENELFNTPILLDGDKLNLHVDNIVWRPRWFAWHYTRQFFNVPNWYFYGPIVDRATLREYRNYIEVAMTHGLLCQNIMESIYNGLLTFPTHQKFAYVV